MAAAPKAKYRFEVERRDYSDLASGRVIYGSPGATAFPVRLASELFQRANEHLGQRELTVYDPLCGSGYLLTVIGIVHGDQIRRILASDADPRAVALAKRNLGLLTQEGLHGRIQQLEQDRDAFGKNSHAEAVEAALRLRAQLSHDVPSRAWVADATNEGEVRDGLSNENPDLVLTDVPYGRLKRWSETGSTRKLLDSLTSIALAGSLFAIAAKERDDLGHPALTKVEQWKLGTRWLTILRAGRRT
jgi:23S rRNA G2445 N2-methylase RlmL